MDCQICIIDGAPSKLFNKKQKIMRKKKNDNETIQKSQLFLFIFTKN